MEKVIIPDPGHGGEDRANQGPTGYIEADGVLDIGLRLKELLIKEGYPIKMTREKDETVALYDRAQMANRWQGRLFISLHTNAGTETSNGIETFYTLNNEWQNQQHHQEAKRAAEILQRNLVEATGLRDRGIKTRLVDNATSPIHGKDYYAVIRRSNMPAILVEMGFHSNPREEALLKTPAFRQKLAEALLKGMKEVYPLKKQNIVEKQNIKLNIHGMPSQVEGIFYENKNYVPVTFLRELGYKVTGHGTNVEIEYRKEQ
ncbi:N-acetylmuramoyl-L-alanine amidase family protein [Clostridium formicaceticum]|uniref:N-acetylmuramoyl-L-alanine amidase AmiA n=1 Tax=Clostridium formicaceticum TaxID=1497 RepID=A0AAC9RKQ6_9CLOT|nr:N-acetylmuramoyl-L-alanine amidase [Clostridium formicaceticum]AOY76697.1 hypothetical protein BJL90_12965 [Clostridium formicaceticum]ARE87130.1 N-acetylmuramoyl-L-alanine amidase AmiA precursor [Clostridium formicaceticum]